MMTESAIRWSGLAATLALLGLQHCGGPSLQLRAPPSLTARLPTAPTVPQPVSDASTSRATNSGHLVTSTHPVANPREQTILLLLSGDDQLRGALAEILPTTLVGARFTRVLMPPSLDGVSGSVERGASGERTTLNGPAERLLPMRANTPIDGVLRVELRRASDAVVSTTRFAVSSQALQRYSSELRSYNTALEAARQQLMSSASYAQESQSAIQRYQAQGGRLDSSETRERVEEVIAFNTRYAELESQLRAALSAPLPQPSEVQRMAEQRSTSSRSSTPGVWLRAIYTDLRGGETFWIDEVRVSESDDTAALRQAIGTLMLDLSGS